MPLNNRRSKLSPSLFVATRLQIQGELVKSKMASFLFGDQDTSEQELRALPKIRLRDRYSDQESWFVYMYASGQASLYLNSIHLILCISPYVTHFRTTAPKLRISPSFQRDRGNEGNVFHFQTLFRRDLSDCRPLGKVASLGLIGFDG